MRENTEYWTEKIKALCTSQGLICSPKEGEPTIEVFSCPRINEKIEVATVMLTEEQIFNAVNTWIECLAKQRAYNQRTDGE